MSDDKIEEIRARYAGYSLNSENAGKANEDRGWLLAEVERLRADLATQQGCCDGAAAQDAHVRREREEHRAEVEKLRAEIERLRADRRERIATAALQGLLSNSSTSSSPWEIVVAATVYADALIAELDKEEGKP